jgi:hypothetical protein
MAKTAKCTGLTAFTKYKNFKKSLSDEFKVCQPENELGEIVTQQ